MGTKRKPESGGSNKLPRNFLADGTRIHQLLKSAKDILSSADPSTFSENCAALTNTSRTS